MARLYGMMDVRQGATTTVRTVFFIDDKGIVRALIYYPLSLGRNIDELLRVIDGLQVNAAEGVATPADWTPGQACIIPAPVTAEGMRERVKEVENDAIKAWYYKTTT